MAVDRPAWELAAGSPAIRWTGPDFARLDLITLTADGAQGLEALGLRVNAPGLGANYLFLPPDLRDCQMTLNLSGSSGNVIVLGHGSRNLRAALHFRGNDNLFCFHGSTHNNNMDVLFVGDGSSLLYGSFASANGLHVRLHGHQDTLVAIGEDSMIAGDVRLMTHDAHGIFDLETGRLVNLPGNILIGRHTWIGESVTVKAGGVTGRGAIIGAKAFLSGEVPDGAIAAGVPARVLRHGVGWTREPLPDAAAIGRMIEALARG